MIKIRCKLNYNDKKTGQLRRVGEEYVEENKRAKEIINKGYAVFVEELIEEAIFDVEKETAHKRLNAKK